MTERLKRILKYIVFFGLGAFLFYQAFKNTEFEKLIEDFRKADYLYVIISMVMGYLAFISRGLRWNYLLEPLGKRAKSWNAIHAIAIGYFANLAVPRAGELARCTALRSTDEIPVNRLFGTVVLERIVDTMMLGLFMVISILLQLDRFDSFFTTAFARDSADDKSGIYLKVGIVLFVLASGLVLYLLRNRFVNMPGYAKVREFWNGFKEGLRSLKLVKNKVAFFSHTLFIWAMYYGMLYVVMFAMDATSDIDPLSGLFIMVVGSFGMVIPSPGGIGSYHYLVMLGMGVLGISKTVGVSFATLMHTGQMVMTVVAGLLAMSVIYRERKKLKKNDLSGSD